MTQAQKIRPDNTTALPHLIPITNASITLLEETGLVHEGNLNQINLVGPFNGLPISFFLSASCKGHYLLAANDYNLAKLSQKELLEDE